MKKLSSVEIQRFKYESKEQRAEHVKEMELRGYKCTGEVKKCDNPYSRFKEEYWYGEFFKQSQPD